MNNEAGELKYFAPIAGIFVGVLLISNTVAGKFFSIGSFSFPSGVVLFPVSYIFGDVLTEVEILATPLTYIIVRFLKRKEGIDIYDYETKFSPFRW